MTPLGKEVLDEIVLRATKDIMACTQQHGMPADGLMAGLRICAALFAISVKPDPLSRMLAMKVVNLYLTKGTATVDELEKEMRDAH